MARMTIEERRKQRAIRKAQDERLAKAREEAKKVVAAGKCPTCGRALRRNLALTGWYQCVQYGDGHFRQDQTQPPCSFQCFTE